jgi:hypothetical protein
MLPSVFSFLVCLVSVQAPLVEVRKQYLRLMLRKSFAYLGQGYVQPCLGLPEFNARSHPLFSQYLHLVPMLVSC